MIQSLLFPGLSKRLHLFLGCMVSSKVKLGSLILLLSQLTFLSGTQGYESIRILLLAYGASTATTLLPCLYTVFVTPPTAGVDGLFLTGSQKQIIYMSYVPFLVVPLLMAVDSAVKLWSVVRAAEGGVKRRVVSDVKKAQ